jgi:hypothetical protein
MGASTRPDGVRRPPRQRRALRATRTRPDLPIDGSHGGGLWNRAMLRALGSPLAPLLGGFTAVRYTTGSTVVVLPVQLARHDDGVDIAAAHASLKRWWRHFRSAAPAELWVDGGWEHVELRVLAGDDARAASRRYVARFPSARRSFAPAGAADPDIRMLRADVALPQPGRPRRTGRPRR